MDPFAFISGFWSANIQSKTTCRKLESTPILQIHALLRIFHKQTRPKRSGAVGGLARPSEVARVQNIFWMTIVRFHGKSSCSKQINK